MVVSLNEFDKFLTATVCCHFGLLFQACVGNYLVNIYVYVAFALVLIFSTGEEWLNSTNCVLNVCGHLLAADDLYLWKVK